MGGSEIARLRYEVTDEGYQEDHNQIGVRLLDEDLKHLNHYGSYCRIFPRERLEKVGVCFIGGCFEYVIYALGTLRASVIIDITPSSEELLAEDWVTISQEALEELDRPLLEYPRKEE